MVDKYVKPSIVNYNASPPPDDDSQTSANAVSWSKHKTKLADPIKTLLDAVNTGVDTLADSMFGNAVRADSAGGTMTTSDYGKLIKTSNAVTVTLPTGTDAGSNFTFGFYNSDATNNLTIGRNGANINGAASNLTIYPKQGGIAFCDGTDWWIFVFITPDGINTISGNTTHTGDITMSGASIFDANASIAAHATTMDPWSLGNYVTLTGSAVTFTALANAPQAGAEVELYMNAAHIFTDGAVFEVDGDANYTATIGDRVLLRAKSTTVFTVHPRKKDGKAIISTVAGQVIQVIEGTPYTTYASSTAAFPRDDTVPQNTEGTEIINDCTITPSSATNRLRIHAQVMGLANTTGPITASAGIFQDSTADALAVGVTDLAGTDWGTTALNFTHEMAAGTTSATTFKLRWSANTAGTTYINGINTGRLYGGTMAARLWVEEIKV